MPTRDRSPEKAQAEEQKPSARRNNSRKRSIIIFAVVSLLNIGLLAFLWIQLLTPAPKSANSGDPLVGHPAPDFTLASLQAQNALPISLSNFKGKPVVLNVWSSNCGPCVHEAPFLQQQSQHLQAQGITLIGIDFQDTKTNGLNFLKQYGITYQNVLDASGSTAISYGVTGTPETIFINRQGVVVSRVIGELTEQTLQKNLQLISR